MTDLRNARLLVAGNAMLTGTTVPTLAFGINLRGFEALEGVSMRVVFYDHDIFVKGPLFGAEGHTLRNFTEPTGDPLSMMEVPDCGLPRFPKIFQGSGVLLILEGMVRKARGRWKKDPSAWAYVVHDKQENRVATVGSVKLVTHNELSEPRVVANLIWRADDNVTLSQQRRVMVRVVMGDDAGGFKSGSVFASNMCKKHYLTDNKGECYPIRVWRAPAPKSTTLGGPPPEPEVTPPPPALRTMSPDLTGYWEAHYPDHCVPLTMFIHQAGHAIVGWFQPPPSNIPNDKPAPVPAGFPDHAGTFVGPRDTANGPWVILWGPSNSKFTNDCDPDDTPLNRRENNVGEVSLVPGQPQDDLVQQLDFVLYTPDGTPVNFRMTRRVARLTRWPNRLINKVAQLNKGAIRPRVLAQLQMVNSPIPTSFWDRVSEILSEHNAKLVGAIQKWLDADTAVLPKLARQQAVDELVEVIKEAVGLLHEDQQDVSIPRIRFILYFNSVPFGFERHSISYWMDRMVGRSQEDGMVVDPFMVKMGFAGPLRFAYTLEFESLSASGGLFVGAGGTASGFKVSIKKEHIKDPNHPEKTEPVPDPDWKDSDKHTFIGGFVSVGAGLGVSGTVWKAKDEAGGGMPGKVVFRSFQDLHLKDFEGASFTVTGVKAGNFAFSIAKFDVLSSMFMSLMLQNTSLDTVIEPEKHWGIKKVDLSTFLELYQSPDKFMKKYLFPKKIETTVFQISEGYGTFGTIDSLPTMLDLPPEEDRVDPQKAKSPECTSTTYFDVDSALLSKEMRTALERMLAVYRKLWTEAEAQVAAEAYASPEDTIAHNQVLTDARASAIKQGVVDALGDELAIKTFWAIGHGEKPATDPNIGRLLDPETQLQGNEERIAQEMRDAYPLWRRVDLWAVGWLLLRMKPV